MSKKKIVNEYIGKNIQYLIDSTPEMNRSKLARDLGVDRRTVGRWIDEGIYPEQHIIDIAKYFNVSLDSFLNVEMSNRGITVDDIFQHKEKYNAFSEFLMSLGITKDYIEQSDVMDHSFITNPYGATLSEQVQLCWADKEVLIPYHEYEKMLADFEKFIFNRLDTFLENQ